MPLLLKTPITKPIFHSFLSFSKSFHHAGNLFDKTPQRTLYLLKHSSSDPILVGSIHCFSLKTNSVSHSPICTSLLTSYAKANEIHSSLALFHENPARDLICWNAIINACVLNSHFRLSFSLFKQMFEKFGDFDSTTLVVLLSAVSKTRVLKHGMFIHCISIKKCFDFDCYVSNALISMYSKCCDIGLSELVFKTMQFRDATSYNSIINGAMINGFYEKSVFHFLMMINLGFQVDDVSLSSVIAASTNSDHTFDFGESIHGLAIKLGFQGIQTQTRYTSVSNALVLFYSQYKDIESAKKVFMQNSNKNVVSHNSLIKGLAYNGRLIEALDAFRCMQLDYKTRSDLVTMVALVSPCGELSLLREGKSIHAYNIRCNMLSLDSSIGNNLINMYFRCDCPIYARRLFNKMSNRDLVSWNTMISCYTRNEMLCKEAQILFMDLVHDGLRCNITTFLGILPSFCGKENLVCGQLIHGLVLKYGFVNTLSVVNALMHMYINCGELMVSLSLLKSILFKSDIISWNTIISGLLQNGLVREVSEAFHFMHSNLSVSPDCITLITVLSACVDLKALSCGKSIHGLVLKRLIQFDVRVIDALMNMYFKLGEIECAQNIFEFVEERSLCTWNCMINGYVQNGEGERALELYLEMRNKSFVPNEITIISILGACAQIGDLKHGKEINAHVFRNGLDNNVYIMASLLDTYSKCGTLNLAKKTFKFSQEKSIASWNSMIMAFGLHGEGVKSIGLFQKMCELDIKPTRSTFIALLSACSHAGLVEQGLEYYNLMPVKFGINHSIEHLVCLVEMLGRASRLSEAFKFVKESRFSLDQGVLGALLGACSDYCNNDINVCKSLAQYLFCVEPNNAGYYVTLCNLLASHEMWDQVSGIRRSLRIKGLVKPPAFSFSLIDA